jgi:hypothetical protein
VSQFQSLSDEVGPLSFSFTGFTLENWRVVFSTNAVGARVAVGEQRRYVGGTAHASLPRINERDNPLVLPLHHVELFAYGGHAASCRRVSVRV